MKIDGQNGKVRMPVSLKGDVISSLNLLNLTL